MARPALSAIRGLDIIDLLAAFPGRAFTLSDVVRATGINNASAHAILAALTERGYLARDPARRTYALGALPVAVGQAALAAQPMLARAQAVAAQLARDVGAPALVTTAIGDEMVGMLAVADPSGRPPGLAAGERRPMVPPLGAPFVAWAGEQAIADWLARGTHAGDSTFNAQQAHALALIRQRGFQVTLRDPDAPRLSPQAVPGYKAEMIAAVERMAPAPQPETFDPAREYDVILIAAPVFGADGLCAYNLCLGEFARRLTGSDIAVIAERLVDASLTIMQAR